MVMRTIKSILNLLCEYFAVFDKIEVRAHSECFASAAHPLPPAGTPYSPQSIYVLCACGEPAYSIQCDRFVCTFAVIEKFRNIAVSTITVHKNLSDCFRIHCFEYCHKLFLNVVCFVVLSSKYLSRSIEIKNLDQRIHHSESTKSHIC